MIYKYKNVCIFGVFKVIIYNSFRIRSWLLSMLCSQQLLEQIIFAQLQVNINIYLTLAGRH